MFVIATSLKALLLRVCSMNECALLTVGVSTRGAKLRLEET